MADSSRKSRAFNDKKISAHTAIIPTPLPVNLDKMTTDEKKVYVPFTTNRLCLSVRAQAMREGEDWLSLLTRRDLRIGTSTAGCDP
ncbi:hypothetical protein ONK27_26955, partial [Salmonella enterica subsp. enterica serovar Virginia]|nr:hypothetical protein [Salmonella enterica subsp. enterica serovar Virginia]